MKTLLVLFAVLWAGPAFSQILCSPIGNSTYCGGWDSQMNDRAWTVTPLGPTGTSIITESTPRRSIRSMPTAPLSTPTYTPYTSPSRSTTSPTSSRRSSALPHPLDLVDPLHALDPLGAGLPGLPGLPEE